MLHVVIVRYRNSHGDMMWRGEKENRWFDGKKRGARTRGGFVVQHCFIMQ